MIEEQNRIMITTNYIDSPFGLMQVCATEEALTLLEFADRSDIERQIASLQSFIGSRVEEGTNSIIERTTLELAEYFAGKRQRFSLPLHTPGTPFQQSVWNALIDIPFGETRSYGWLAQKLGDPKSVRAVAHANGQNRIAIIIPCHRVIGADGSLTGYAGGLERKKKLLLLEGATAPVPEGQERLF
ncbi:MAG: methylated-DNA--[protein]-cysteine S-methyltransferase [Candidatus Kapaibacterium sp.]